MADPALDAIQEQVARCNRCGFCQAACPIYHITGREAATARGHNEHLRRVLDGELDLDSDMEPAFAQCLLCRACTAHCFPALPTDRAVTAARSGFNRHRPGAAVEERVMRAVLTDQGRMARLMKLAYFGKRSGALRAMRLLRWLPWFPKGAAEADAMMPSPPDSFLRDRLGRLGLPEQGPRGTIVYFVGCGMNFGYPDAAEDTLRLLAECGYGIRVADNICCGLPAYTHGHLDLARELAEANLRAMTGSDLIVADCASCSSFLKHYEELLGGAPEAEEAAAFAARARDLSEVIAPELLTGARLEGTVTYHQPCHLGRYQGLAARPTELLEAIEEVDFRPLREADWCCGAAGTYVVTQYELSMQVLERKMSNVAATGADTVVTSCPACLAQLGYGAHREGVGVRVRHLSEVLRKAMG
ncbi:MAG: (Fe-S)-binding protein [Armatimonadota bacterium]|nr:MAG: (Fe-S)-binding protein [Armatimonadota bacterium]